MNLKNGPGAKLAIATGKSRRETKWKNVTITWGELVKKLSQAHRTHETVKDYASMKKDEQDNIKDVGGFVGGELKEGKRKNGHVLSRSIVSLDIDFGGPALWDDIELLTDYAMCAYSTHKHTPQKPRLRLIIPLDRKVSPEEYEAIARRLADDIGMDYFDDTTYEPTRLMFWPSTPKDGEYFFEVIDAPILKADKVLKTYTDWKDVSFWPESSRARINRKKTADKQGDPLAKDGLIGAFCRTYTIQDAINKFIPDVYEECNTTGRYTYSGGSTAAGLVIYEDKFAYSNHGTDPISGQLCNAFDLIRIHKFKDLDEDAKENTPINKMPSWTAMMKFIENDEECKKLSAKEAFADAIDEGLIDDEDLTWVSSLERIGKKIDSSYRNILTVFKHDKQLKDLFSFDEMANNVVFSRNVKWRNADYLTCSLLQNNDMKQLRCYLGEVYEIKNERVISDSLINVALKTKSHPVREYLSELIWDGEERLERIFIDYLGASDERYTKEVTKRIMISAVKRVFEPGCKADSMLVLISSQGLGKSSFINALARFPKYFANVSTDAEGKDFMEKLRGKWIIELEEMASIKKSSIEKLKSILSSQQDTYRPAYAELAGDFPRQCVFIGTTNSFSFLKDDTGNRRFWPLEIGVETASKKIVVDDKKTSDPKKLRAFNYDMDQIWAEAYNLYEEGHKHYFTNDELKEYGIIEKQESVTEEDAWLTIISNYLDKKITKDWYSKDLSLRVFTMQNYKDGEKGFNITRSKVCTKEIWCEALGYELASMEKYHGDRITSLLIYKMGYKSIGNAWVDKFYKSQKCYKK